MIKKVVIENFKRFKSEEFELEESIVLAGPNNSGKSTLLQAVSAWSMVFERWCLGKGRPIMENKDSMRVSSKKARTGQPVTRKDFSAIPLREFNLMWNKNLTGLNREELQGKQKIGESRLIHITIEASTGFSNNDTWSLTMELRYQSSEQIYVKPVEISDIETLKKAQELMIVHCPPFSGIGSEERRLDRGAQQLEIGRGKPGDILRNLLLEVFNDKQSWPVLVKDLQEIFRITLLEPDYNEALPFIVCEYLDGIPTGKGKNGLSKYDIASCGSGFHQVLLLLAYFYARPSSVLLLDEPDAHLHVILQQQIYERLRSVANHRSCQLIIATHSEVILQATPPSRIISFLSKPHRLVEKKQRDQVREAMSRLTSLDLLLAEQGRAVLYCEGQSDFEILRCWAEILDHPSKGFFCDPFFHPNGGRDPREAKGHLFALRAIQEGVRGLLLLDGDNREIPEHDLSADGLDIMRWKRYEIENYLLVPTAIQRFLGPPEGQQDLFSTVSSTAAIEYLETQLPRSFFNDPLSDETQAVIEIPASKKLLPQIFDRASRPLEKCDFYLLAEVMKPEEIHNDVKTVLDKISELLP